MKYILLIIVTMSHQNDGRTPVAVDHMTFNTLAACEQMRKAVTSKPKSGGLIGAINGAINGPIIDARECEAVDDTAGE